MTTKATEPKIILDDVIEAINCLKAGNHRNIFRFVIAETYGIEQRAKSTKQWTLEHLNIWPFRTAIWQIKRNKKKIHNFNCDRSPSFADCDTKQQTHSEKWLRISFRRCQQNNAWPNSIISIWTNRTNGTWTNKQPEKSVFRLKIIKKIKIGS